MLARVLGDAGIVRHFHLVDGERIGIELKRLVDGVFPLVFGLAQHARDQVDVDLSEADIARGLISPPDFRRFMSAAVDRQDLFVEMLDAQAQPGDADFLDGLELAFLERARLTFESHFAGGRPGPVFVDALNEPFELRAGEVGRGATAEIDKFELPATEPAVLGIEGDFAR